MRNQMEVIRSFVKDNQKKLGIAFLSLLGLGIVITGVWYSQSQNKANELTEMTISKVKEVKEVKQEERSPKKEEAKKTEQKDKVEVKDKNKKEETKSEAKGSTVVIESEAKKETSKEEKKQTSVETREENKQGKESVVTKVTPTKKEETKPVKTNTTTTTQTQPVTKPAETKSSTPAPKKEEVKKDPNEGKVWREAEYRTIQVPAVTEKRWVVDETAWTEQVMVGSYYLTSNGVSFYDLTSLDRYLEEQALAGNPLSYRSQPQYESVYHEEKGHWEDVVITPATTRQELVREAGWY